MCLSVSVCFIKTPCQVGYVQYIHTFTHSTVSNGLWLLRTHIRRSGNQSLTPIMQKQQEFVAKPDISLSCCFSSASSGPKGVNVCLCMNEGMRSTPRTMVFSWWLWPRLPFIKFSNNIYETTASGQICDKLFKFLDKRKKTSLYRLHCQPMCFLTIRDVCYALKLEGKELESFSHKTLSVQNV